MPAGKPWGRLPFDGEADNVYLNQGRRFGALRRSAVVPVVPGVPPTSIGLPSYIYKFPKSFSISGTSGTLSGTPMVA